MGNCLGSEGGDSGKKYAATAAAGSGDQPSSTKRLSAQKVDPNTQAGVNELAKKSALLRVSANPDKLAKSSAASKGPSDMMSAINDEWHERKDNNGVLPSEAAAPAAATSTAVADASKAVTDAAKEVATAANTAATHVANAVNAATNPAPAAAAAAPK